MLLLMSELRLQLLRFGPPYTGDEGVGGLPMVTWEEWKSRAEADAGLSVWPLVAGKTRAAQLSYDSAYDRDGEGVLRAALVPIVGEKVAGSLAGGVGERALHNMLRFLFFGSGKRFD